MQYRYTYDIHEEADRKSRRHRTEVSHIRWNRILTQIWQVPRHMTVNIRRVYMIFIYYTNYNDDEDYDENDDCIPSTSSTLLAKNTSVTFQFRSPYNGIEFLRRVVRWWATFSHRKHRINVKEWKVVEQNDRQTWKRKKINEENKIVRFCLINFSFY